MFDLIFLLISLTDVVVKYLTLSLKESPGHSLHEFIVEAHIHLIPYFLYPLHNIVLSASIFMTVSISIERYMAIFSPLTYRNRFSISCVLKHLDWAGVDIRSSSWNLVFHVLPVLVVSVLINIPKFFESEVSQTENISMTNVFFSDYLSSKQYKKRDWCNPTEIEWALCSVLSELRQVKYRQESQSQSTYKLKPEVDISGLGSSLPSHFPQCPSLLRHTGQEDKHQGEDLLHHPTSHRLHLRRL